MLCELFLVDGDSAGRSAIHGRYRSLPGNLALLVNRLYDSMDAESYINCMSNGSEGSGTLGVNPYKVLGEMNPDQLRDTTMDPSRCTLLKIPMEDAFFFFFKGAAPHGNPPSPPPRPFPE